VDILHGKIITDQVTLMAQGNGVFAKIDISITFSPMNEYPIGPVSSY